MKTMHSALLAGAALLLVPSAGFAQEAPAPQPAVVETQAAAPMADVAALPANSEVVLAINETVTSGTHRMGEKVFFTVAQDVKVDGRTVIPQGTRAVGQITRRTGKGSFGKSGKMDVAFRYIDLNGQRIPIQGLHHQEGSGATAATIGAVVAAGVVGGLLVHGKSARIAQGREFTVRTKDSIPVTFSSEDGTRAVIAASYTPSRVSMMAETEKQRKAREKAERARGKKAK
ncbi:MAG: hypothetical protein QOG72_3094 [Sphingomonadales bacterium]|jgi:hypothetical protein|nr:hypothetical protein [Sphingomonadales bacterium]